MSYPEIIVYPIMNTYPEHTIISDVRMDSSSQCPNRLSLYLGFPDGVGPLQSIGIYEPREAMGKGEGEHPYVSRSQRF